MHCDIRPWDDSDVPSLVGSLHELRPSGYPPLMADVSTAELEDWLLEDGALVRLVAACGDRPVGHVQVTEAHEYVVTHLPNAQDRTLLEIGKLFVAPSAQGHHAGKQLLAAALDEISARGAVPVLAVLPGSEAAIQLYDSVGLAVVGSFDGVHGLNFLYSNGELASPKR